MVQYVGISTIEDLRVALETRKKVVLAQFIRRLSGERHEWLGRGISVFHLFQVMVAEKNDPREMAKAFAAFGFGEPSNEAVPPTVVETFNEIKLVREKLP